MALKADTIVRGKYRITRLIGDGGMGAVYEAEHLILKVPVALKFLHTELAQRPGLSERFLREARVSASVQNPHVTRVTDVDTTDAGTPFLVMELLRGRSLQDLLDRERQLPEAVAIDYALQILSGLEAAHALNVVHRDLKPDNVFITQTQGGPVLKLIDFGIAKLRSSEEFRQTLTQAGSMMGTPEYMAPEQLYAAETVDARADLFSLGVMLYEMLCGERPVLGDDATAIVAAYVEGNAVPLRQKLPGASQALEDVLSRAIEHERERRFESAFSMRMALIPLATSLSHAGRLAATPEPLPLDGPLPNLDEHDEEADPSTQRTSVPDTLPPADATSNGKATSDQEAGRTADDPLMQGEGGTEDAPHLPKQLRGQAPAMAPPASPVAQKAGAEFRVRAAHVPVPHAVPTRKGRKGSGLVVALSILLVLIAGAMLALLAIERRQSEPPPQGVTATVPTGVRTINAELPTQDSAPPSTLPSSDPRTPPPTTRPRPTPAPPTSRPTTPDAGRPAIPFPSTLPPLPSQLPPLPSGFPTTLPSFFPPIPGLTPPGVAPAPTGDADPKPPAERR